MSQLQELRPLPQRRHRATASSGAAERTRRSRERVRTEAQCGSKPASIPREGHRRFQPRKRPRPQRRRDPSRGEETVRRSPRWRQTMSTSRFRSPRTSIAEGHRRLGVVVIDRRRSLDTEAGRRESTWPHTGTSLHHDSGARSGRSRHPPRQATSRQPGTHPSGAHWGRQSQECGWWAFGATIAMRGRG